MSRPSPMERMPVFSVGPESYEAFIAPRGRVTLIRIVNGEEDNGAGSISIKISWVGGCDRSGGRKKGCKRSGCQAKGRKPIVFGTHRELQIAGKLTSRFPTVFLCPVAQMPICPFCANLCCKNNLHIYYAQYCATQRDSFGEKVVCCNGQKS